mmetsp:Transcript_23314/g.55028  ORF Transcript_23314/g.55028 Transcript_23314/m.55028 type:complete len:627 (-) Transcript_23314:557-2437(-)
MGINDLLSRLPGGSEYNYSFFELGWRGKTVHIDAAGALFECAAAFASDFISGNHTPALVVWARKLVYLRSICGWNMVVYMDGRTNPAKQFEDERRTQRRLEAVERNDLRGQIKNTPEYYAEAMEVCKFLNIDVRVAHDEADPQVSYVSIKGLCIPVTIDSDLLAYGVPKICIFKLFEKEVFRIIDLTRDDVEEGEYKLFDLYKAHGAITFQLYAGCLGCDFTAVRSGIKGIGYEKFIEAAAAVDGQLPAATLAASLWRSFPQILEKNSFDNLTGVEAHLQEVVDVYAQGKVYDSEANIRDINDKLISPASPQTKQHMSGTVNCRTGEPHPQPFREKLLSLQRNCNQLIATTAADVSNIEGIRLPASRESPVNCNVTELRNFIACRGGKVGGTKNELVKTVKANQFLEKQVSRNYVQRDVNKEGSLFHKSINSTSSSMAQILTDLHSNGNKFDTKTRGLIALAFRCHEQGLFEEEYANIARVSPELPPDLIYRSYAHVGMSLQQKSIADSLKRMFMANEVTCHALALLPEERRAIIFTKCIASMKADEKREKTADNQTKKDEYTQLIELLYEDTDRETSRHDLGVFVKVGRTYCTKCVAGQGDCRHKIGACHTSTPYLCLVQLGKDI